MSSRNLLLAAAACAVLATPALSQTTTPPLSTAPTPIGVSPPAVLSTTTAPVAMGDMFYRGSWMPTHWRASDAIGQAVYNKANEKVGDIEDVLIDGDGRVLAAVIGVGGFLGMGEHKVAVTYNAFQMSRDAAGKSKIVIDFDKTALKNAPQYKTTEALKKL